MSILNTYRKGIGTIREETLVKKALKQMIRGNFNSFVVVNVAGDIVGILSIPDIAAATVPLEMQESVALAQSLIKPGFFAQACKEVAELPVKDVMRTDFATIHPDADIMEIAAIYLHQDLHAVPVVDEAGKLVGIVTRTEIRQALADGMGIRQDSTQ